MYLYLRLSFAAMLTSTSLYDACYCTSARWRFHMHTLPSWCYSNLITVLEFN